MAIRILAALFFSCFFANLSYGEEEHTFGEMKAIVIVDDEGKIEKNPDLSGVQIVGIELPGSHRSQVGLVSEIERRFLHRNLGLNDLEEIKYRVILYYKEKGSSLIRVIVPPQDVTDGILHLIVKESRVGEVRTLGNCWSSACFTERTIGLEPGDKIDTNELNADLIFLNRNPFKTSDVIFTPGREPHTTDIEVVTIEQKAYMVYGGMDNRGNETIGNFRQFEGFNCGDFLGLDHILSYQFTTALPLKRMRAHAGYYEIPLPYRMSLVGFGGYSKVSTKTYSKFMRNDGYNVQVSGRYHFPLIACGKAVNDISFGFDYKRTNNNILFSEIPIVAKTATLSQFVLGYQYQDIRPKGLGVFSFEFFFSPVKWFSNQNKNDYDLLSPGAIPHYFYILTSWEKDFYLPKCQRIFVRLKGQYANQNLLPSEQLGLGGFDTVRGYHEREINGENGFLGNLEWKSPLLSAIKMRSLCGEKVEAPDQLLFVAFLDYGIVGRHKNVPGADNTQWIMGVGPGFQYVLSNYFKASVYWGLRLKSSQLTSAPGGRLHFSVVASY